MIENGGRESRKNRKHPVTAFYIEALILVAVFTIVILVLTRVFAWSGQIGRKAALLTNAVHLSENAAEAVAASDSLEEVMALLDENGNAQLLEEGLLRVWYDEDMNPMPEGNLWLDVTWVPEESASAGGKRLVESQVTVYGAGDAGSIYTLETAVLAEGQ